MYVRIFVCVFQVLTQLGGCTNSSKKERKDQGGNYEASSRFTRLGGMKSISGYISRSLSGQDARMGFHMCIVRYVFGIPVSHCSGKPNLMVRSLFVLY